MKFIFPVLVLLCIVGCATSYQERGFLSGGFSETQLDTNVWRVSFDGNSNTRDERASDFALLRGAELTLEHGYEYFVVVDSEVANRTGTLTMPTHQASHGTATVRHFGNTSQVSMHGTTTTHGGETMNYSKPRRHITIVAAQERPADVFSYNARFIESELKAKYRIGAK
jgi:hypothetical protein